MTKPPSERSVGGFLLYNVVLLRATNALCPRSLEPLRTEQRVRRARNIHCQTTIALNLENSISKCRIDGRSVALIDHAIGQCILQRSISLTILSRQIVEVLQIVELMFI